MQRVRLGRRIDVATRGRSAHPSLLRMRVGAAESSGFNFCCRSLDQQRGRLSEALLYSILLPRRRHDGCFPQSLRWRVLNTRLGRSPSRAPRLSLDAPAVKRKAEERWTDDQNENSLHLPASRRGPLTAKASWNNSTFVGHAVTNRIANATYVLDLGLQRPAVLANSNFVILQPC